MSPDDRRPVLIPLLALLVLASLAATAPAQEGLIIEDVRFEGNRLYSRENLLLRMKLRKGHRYDDRLIEEDIKTLYRFFRDVRVERITSGAGLTLVYHVAENPRTVAVRVVGNRKFKTNEILDALQTKRGFPLFDYALTADRNRLVRQYREKGFHFAQVLTKVEDKPGGKLVTFNITEGPEVDIDEITFRGNASFEADDIIKKSRMVSQESGFLTSGEFVLETLERDLVGIMEFYRAEGFRDVRVWLGALEFSEDKEDVNIRIDVDEGEPYHIDEIEIRGGETFPADPGKLRALLTIKVGDRYRMEDVYKSRGAIEEFYKENAYWGSQIIVEDAIYRAEGSGAGLVIRIVEGAPVSIDRIVIEGNERTRDKVIRRELSVVPGGPLNAVELRKSLIRLSDLRFFEPMPAIEVVDTADPARKDVRIRVKEGNTGSIRFSAGVNSNLGLIGQVTLTKENFDYRDLPSSFSDVIESKAFTGGGQTLQIFAAPGSSYSQFRVRFREPWLFDRRLGGDFAFYKTKRFRRGYDIDRLGVKVDVDKRWLYPGEKVDDVLVIRGGIRIENPKVDRVDNDDAPKNAIEDEGLYRVRSIPIGASYSRVDSRADPSQGWTTSLGYELGTGLGNIEFHKIIARGGVYTTLYTDRQERKHVLSLTGAAGWQTGYGDTDDIPISERFFLGGLGTVRGFSYQTIGPKSNDEAEGGEAMYHGSLEYNFPIYERLLGGVLFVDVGNVTDRWGGPDFINLIRVAPGFGLRISIPLLGRRPVELAFGIPLIKHQSDDTQVFSFSFGRDF